jgi:hypothetical protein
MIRFSTLKAKGKYLAVDSGSKKFLLGFMENKDAHLVKRILPENPKVFVKSVEPRDITKTIKANMLESNMAIFNVADSITLDTNAEIVFPKIKVPNDVIPPCWYDVNVLEYDQFMSFPFYNNVGVIMPYEMIYSNDDVLVYRANMMTNILQDTAGNYNDLEIEGDSPQI